MPNGITAPSQQIDFAELLRQRKSQRQPDSLLSQPLPQDIQKEAIGQQVDFSSLLRKRKEQRALQEPAKLVAQADIRAAEAKGELGFFGAIGEAITGKRRGTEATRARPELGKVVSLAIEKDVKQQRTSFAPQELEFFKESTAAQGLPFESLERITQKVPLEQLKRVGTALSFTNNPQEQLQIIKQQIPDAQFDVDEKGNVLVDIAGEKIPLNRPGLSDTETTQFLLQALTFAAVPGGGAQLARLIPGATKALTALGKRISGKAALTAASAAAPQALIEKAQEELCSFFFCLF